MKTKSPAVPELTDYAVDGPRFPSLALARSVGLPAHEIAWIEAGGDPREDLPRLNELWVRVLIHHCAPTDGKLTPELVVRRFREMNVLPRREGEFPLRRDDRPGRELKRRRAIAVLTQWRRPNAQYYDPIESVRGNKARVRAMIEESSEELRASGNRWRVGRIHFVWACAAQKLRKRYGVEWFDPAAMNPNSFYD